MDGLTVDWAICLARLIPSMILLQDRKCYRYEIYVRLKLNSLREGDGVDVLSLPGHRKKSKPRVQIALPGDSQSVGSKYLD